MMPHTALSHGSANKTCVDPMSKSVEKSLAMRLANEIREAIVSARFDLGEALSEESLAAAFEVSRTPVREALALLQTEGLVNVVAKSGSYVFSPTEDDIVELCEHRVTLEVEASRRALERNPEATLQALRDALAQMIMALEQDDRLAYGAADTEFHLSFSSSAPTVIWWTPTNATWAVSRPCARIWPGAPGMSRTVRSTITGR